MAFVYLLGDSGHDNIYKIGITRNAIDKRIKQLQTGNSGEIFLINYYETDYPFYFENILHLKYYPNQKKGEWFELDDEDVLNFKSICESLEKNIEPLKNNPFSKNILK